MNSGVVYAVFGYEAHNQDELTFDNGDRIVVLRKGDDTEREWWWSRIDDREGYVPRNLLGVSSSPIIFVYSVFYQAYTEFRNVCIIQIIGPRPYPYFNFSTSQIGCFFSSFFLKLKNFASNTYGRYFGVSDILRITA